MATLDFKPHILSYEVSKWGTLENGDRIETKTYWVKNYIRCDVVASSGAASQKEFLDGKKESYSYTVYLPRGTREFKYGEKVRIKFFGRDNDEKEFTVVGFQRYQLQAKLWVSE